VQWECAEAEISGVLEAPDGHGHSEAHSHSKEASAARAAEAHRQVTRHACNAEGLPCD